MSVEISPRKRQRKGKMGEKEKGNTMGYPLDEHTFSLLPELMSFQEYTTATKGRVMNYSYWLPIYLNEEHFLGGRVRLEKALLHLSNLLKGKNTKKYTPFAALRVFPKILNRLGAEMMTSNGAESEAMVHIYSDILRLFTRMLDDDEGGAMWGELDMKIERFLAGPWGCPLSIGEVMVLLAMSKKYSFADDEVKRCVLEEFFVRKVGEVERYVRGQPLLQTKADDQVEEEGERQVRRELRGRIVQSMKKDEIDKLSSKYNFTISNYGGWRRAISFPSSFSSSFTIAHTKRQGNPGLEWGLSSSKRQASLRLVSGWETWGVDWELTVRVSFGLLKGKKSSQVVVLNAKNKVVDVTEEVLWLFGEKEEEVELVVEAKVNKITSAIHEDRQKRDAEKRYRKELPGALKEWKKVKDEKEKKVRKVESLEGQLSVHFGATGVTNKALVFGALAPRWFLVEGAKGVLDASFGVLPKKVVVGVMNMVEMIVGMEGYEGFFQALEFEKVVGGGKGMAKFIRRAELELEGNMNLDPFLFVWRQWLNDEGQR